MAQFTQLSQSDVESLCAQFSLGSLLGWESVAAGTINSNYKLDTSLGRYFLRVNEGKSEGQVALEVQVLEHLVAEGIATPLPQLSRSGQRFALWKDKFISVFAWQPGSHVDSNTISANHCREAGRALAALHLAGKSMNLSAVGPGRYSHSKIKSLFATFAEEQDPELATVVPILRKELAWLDEKEALRSQVASGLIHADLFPDNVLVEELAVVALLDFEQACQGSLVYDLAVAINAWCFAEKLVPERLRALVAGYAGLCPLSSDELAALTIEVRAAALRFTVTRITDVYLPARASGGETEGKDFRRFQMRLETWQALGAEGFCQIAELAKVQSTP